MTEIRPLRAASLGTALWLALFSVALADDAPEARQEESRPPAISVGPATWFAQVIAHSEMGLNVTYFWSKGPMMRAETVVAGHKIVTIVRGDRYYAYDVINQSGISIVRTVAALEYDAPNRRPFGNELEKLLDQGAEKVREEQVMGRTCDVYRVTDRRGRRDVWVTKGDTRLPIRMEVWDRSRGTTFATDYLNWQSGLHISDQFFEPASGMEIQDFELEEYFKNAAKQGPAGPVPILYSDLITGPLKR